MVIKLRRAYDPPRLGEGTRFLVDRLWPRGLKKESLAVDRWLKQVAPSAALRRWVGHDHHQRIGDKLEILIEVRAIRKS